MIQNVIRKDFGAGGGTEQNSYNLADVNALVVTSDVEPGLTDYLSVVLKSSKHEQEVLVNRISLRALAAISDVEFGSSALLQSRLNQVTEGGAFDLAGFAFAVPLGCLYMRANDSALDVTLEVAQAGASKWSVAAVFNDADTDSMVKWVESRVLTDKATDVDQVWLFNAAGTEILAPFSRDVSALVTSDHGAMLATYPDLFGVTGAFGGVEAQGPQYCMKLFDAPDALHSAVSWNISGSEASDFRVITRSVSRNSARVSRGTIAAVARVERQLTGRTPAQIQALKRAGIIPGDQKVMAQIRQKLNVPTAQEV